MDDVLYIKFRQHGDLRTLLLNTFPADLVYVQSEDPFWGDGAGTGMNELGKSLMHVRERLRNLCGFPLLSGLPVHYHHLTQISSLSSEFESARRGAAGRSI